MTYICPMHSNIVSETPGMCPECGMALVEIKSKPHFAKKASRSRHEGHSVNMFARKFWVSLALTILIFLFWGSNWIQLLLASAIFFYGGWVFLIGAWREIRGKAPGMMTLIALAITTAYAYSVVQVLVALLRQGFAGRAAPETLFWELSTLIVIMLLGHWLEMRGVQGAQGALKELSKLLPDTAERVKQHVASSMQHGKNEETESVSLSELRVVDVVIVRPGGKIPADGEIIEGTSEVNESTATGE